MRPDAFSRYFVKSAILRPDAVMVKAPDRNSSVKPLTGPGADIAELKAKGDLHMHMLTQRRLVLDCRLVGFVLAAALILSSGTVHTQTHTPLSDQQIRTSVEHEISEADVNPTNVKVDVRNRIVTLTGTVPSLWSRNEILDEIADIDDVESVVSYLTVAAAEATRTLLTRWRGISGNTSSTPFTTTSMSRSMPASSP